MLKNYTHGIQLIFNKKNNKRMQIYKNILQVENKPQ